MGKISFLDFLAISRPISFILLFLCLTVAFLFSANISQLTIYHIIEFLLIIFLMPFFIFSINDYYDLNSDRINERKGNLLQGKIIAKDISKQDIDRINLTIFFVLLFSSFTFRNLVHTLILFLALFFSYFYSAKPLRLKEIPIIDSLSNGAIVLSIFAMIYYLFNDVSDLPFRVIAVAISIVSYHLIMAQVDRTPDIKSGQKTTAIFLRSRFAVYLLCLFYNVPLLFAGFASVFKYLFYINLIILGFAYFNEKNSKSIVFLFIISWVALLLLYVVDKLV